MTNDYTVWIVSPPELIWSHVFDELAIGLQSAFRSLGYGVEIVTDPKAIEGVPIVLGANLCPMYNITLPANAIIYNFEQVHPASRWFDLGYGYIELLKKHPVWDFSKTNIHALKAFGIEDVVHCAVGYVPELTRIRRSKEDIDVVFVGGGHPRRQKILDHIAKSGARLHTVYKVFGKERDDWIARGKIHLNLHKEPAGLFEIVRVSYLLANRCFVISENCTDTDITDEFREGVVFCDYDQLVERTLHYLVTPKERKRIAEAGFELFRKRSQSDYLAQALEDHRRTQALKREVLSATYNNSRKAVLPMPRIFVAIASYRDTEIQPTIQDLFSKASYPSRINVGVCLQIAPEEDKGCTIHPDLRPAQVRVAQFHYSESKGANWARVKAIELKQDEEYVLMIDSHMRFAHGWDEAMLEMLSQCVAEKPVLSGYVPDYNPPNRLIQHQGVLLRTRLRRPKHPSDPRLIHISGEMVPLSDERTKTLYPSPFCIANFIFMRSSVLDEVPIDPHIHFWGDEINFAARLWTHGYDIFQPNRIIIYHYWVRKEHFHLHDYREYFTDENKRSLARIRHLLGLKKTDDAQALVDIKKYGLGNARSLKDLWAFAGIDWKKYDITADAEEGIWNMTAREKGRGKQSAASGQSLQLFAPDPPPTVLRMDKPRIFVQIASYRDPDCQLTVKDLFEKATHPERITVGICWQFIREEDQSCFVVPYPYPDQVRVHEVDARQSKGVCWARGLTQKMWQGEEFTFQIDSHMRFEQGWDEMLLSMWKDCGSEKAVLTCYPPAFTPPDKMESKWIFGMSAKEFDIYGIFLMLGAPSFEVGVNEPSRPLLGAFASANTLFGPSSMIRDVPYDPELYFFGEEISMAVRLWTHGYDLYHPNRLFIYHDWYRWKRPTHFGDNKDWQKANEISFGRVKHLLNIERSNDPVVLHDLDKYGLGNVRTLEQYQEYSGVDFAQRQIQPHSYKGNFSFAKARPELTQDIIVNLPHTTKNTKSSPMTTQSAGKMPKIFINIASYRDPECQWTVKDLFEKATYPDRINVGICWQFDPAEDKHCFEISTRPEQVRMLPVDWREAQGVCWARHETQKLWEGEEYTLMTDSHMRFVPGWDELMIKELDACESSKPVLSCSPVPYTPPNNLGTRMYPTIRRVKPFQPDGNIRCQGEMLDRSPPKPLKGAFLVANFIFSRSEITSEVPYDPFLYFDQEEISYAARVYTYGWDVFSARNQFLYHFYNDAKVPTGSVRPLHWRDLHKENEQHIRFLRERGLKRFNHLTKYNVSTDPDVIQQLDLYGFGPVRTLEQYEQFSGVDFKNKVATERALRCQFIENLHLYRDRPIHVPEVDDNKPKAAQAAAPVQPVIPARTVAPVKLTNSLANDRTVPLMPKPAVVATHVSLAAPKAEQQNTLLPAFPQMLEPGDFFPLIELDDTSKKVRAIEVFAGKFCIVTYLPSDQPEFLAKFFQEQGQRTTAARIQDTWQIFILDDTAERLIELRQRLNIASTLHADPNRIFARAAGIARRGENFTPVGFVLNTNLKILHRHSSHDPLQLSAGLVHYCAVEMEKRKEKDTKRQIISQMAPALIVPDVLSPELCAKCLHAFNTGNTFDGTVGALEGKAYRADIKVRTDYVVHGELLAELDDKLSRSFYPEIKKIFGFEVTHRELFKIGMYSGEKNGFFKQHRDNFDAPLGYRRVAATIQLNDDYEGGGLRFPEYDDHVYRPPMGAAIAFSCSTLHEARPVTKGARYVVVGFFHGQQDEAFRHYFVKSKNGPTNQKDFNPVSRRYPDVRQSRGFYEKWQKENVSFTPENKVAAPLESGLITPTKTSLGVMIKTAGDHQARKMMETRQAIVIDDFLPEDTYKSISDYMLTADYERINTTGKSVRAWHVHDGFPLRSTVNMFYNAHGSHSHSGEHVYPTKLPLDRLIEHILAAQPSVEHIVGKQSVDWEHFSATGWMYPHGTALSMHDDGSGVYTGAYVYFLNPIWRPHWGGLLVLADEEANRKVHEYRKNVDQIDYYKRKWLHANPLDEMVTQHGFGQVIFPKRNRIVFIANDAYHMVTRINEQSGDNLRMSLAGFFNKKK